MAAKKIRANILGKDINLLKNVSKRVAQNRPADVQYFTEVKDFLMNSVNDKPDIVAISVNYPHKSASKLPRVIKMALNTPVIVFGEDQDSKTRKDLSTAKADYKIPGVLTAHNFWMKLVNFKKQQEKQDAESEAALDQMNSEKIEVNSEVDKADHFGPLNKELDSSINHIMGKGELENIINQDENSIIDSLFSQMGSEPKKNKANIISHKPSSKLSGGDSSHLHWDAEESQLHTSGSEDNNSVLGMIDNESTFSHIQGGGSGPITSPSKLSDNDFSLDPSSKDENRKESGQGSFTGTGLTEEPAKEEKEKEKPFLPDYAT
ncbi:MAG: hypothetical protein MJK18_04925, partial [Bdellovibrionales bacterium]|nr:hypothetical protein [Bdellovibrionales bacterium]